MSSFFCTHVFKIIILSYIVFLGQFPGNSKYDVQELPDMYSEQVFAFSLNLFYLRFKTWHRVESDSECLWESEFEHMHCLVGNVNWTQTLWVKIRMDQLPSNYWTEAWKLISLFKRLRKLSPRTTFNTHFINIQGMIKKCYVFKFLKMSI